MAPKVLSKEYVNDSSSSEDDSDQGAIRPHVIKNAKKSSKSEKHQETSSSGSESQSDSSSELSSSEEAESAQVAKPVANKHEEQQRSHKGSRSSSRPSHIPTTGYQAPQGFTPMSRVSADVASLSEVFGSRLASQQVWHITAPSNVPLSSIKSLDIKAVLRGDPILEHNGVKYNMHALPANSESLLLPMQNNNGAYYQVSQVPVSRNLCLQGVAGAEHSQSTASQRASGMQSGLVDDDTSFYASETGSKKAARQQPKGLLKRYHPYGSSVNGKEKMRDPSGADDESDQQEREPDQQNGFHVPNSMQIDRPVSPRKEKKSKKRSQSSREPTSSQIEIDSPAHGHSTAIASHEKKRKKKDNKEQA